MIIATPLSELTFCFSDEDLAAMYLSDKKAGRPRLDSDHDELEVLLESFSKQVEEIVNESETMMVCIFFQVSTSSYKSPTAQYFCDTRNRRTNTRCHS